MQSARRTWSKCVSTNAPTCIRLVMLSLYPFPTVPFVLKFVVCSYEPCGRSKIVRAARSTLTTALLDAAGGSGICSGVECARATIK